MSMGNRWASSRCMTQLVPLGVLAALQGALPLPVLHLPLFLTTCSPLALPCLLLLCRSPRCNWSASFVAAGRICPRCGRHIANRGSACGDGRRRCGGGRHGLSSHPSGNSPAQRWGVEAASGSGGRCGAYSNSEPSRSGSGDSDPHSCLSGKVQQDTAADRGANRGDCGRRRPAQRRGRSFTGVQGQWGHRAGRTGSSGKAGVSVSGHLSPVASWNGSGSSGAFGSGDG